MRILGIDPGLRLTGYGCVEPFAAPTSKRKRAGEEVTLLEAGVIRLKPTFSVSKRLLELDSDLREIIDRLKPDAVAVEKLFAHYKHPLTGVIMAHARGVVLLCAQRHGAQLIELGATQVKKSLTGNGHASKSQIQLGVRAQLGLAEAPDPPDIADAIAIALCALRRVG